MPLAPNHRITGRRLLSKLHSWPRAHITLIGDTIDQKKPITNHVNFLVINANLICDQYIGATLVNRESISKIADLYTLGTSKIRARTLHLNKKGTSKVR